MSVWGKVSTALARCLESGLKARVSLAAAYALESYICEEDDSVVRHCPSMWVSWILPSSPQLAMTLPPGLKRAQCTCPAWGE